MNIERADELLKKFKKGETMKGSEKQITWAEEIRLNMQPEFDSLMMQVTDNAPAIKAINYINDLNWASFWIDNKRNTPTEMLRSLCGGGLQIRGSGYSHTATVDQATGVITITWHEIVSDGHGGHHEIKTQTL